MLWFTAGVSLALLCGITWYFTTPFRMIANARHIAIQNQPALLREAQIMLDEAKQTPGNNLEYGLKHPMPATIAKLGGYSAYVSPRYPGTVKIAITGGFTHYGLYIIPQPTTATLQALPQSKIVKIVNEHIIQFDDER